MKSTAKKLAVCAAALCLLACGTAVSAAAASPVSGLALSGVAMPWDQDVPAESIEAGSYTANMLLGSSQQLSPVVRPRNSTDSVVFISDDTSILTVSNSGVVQAVGVGTTRITAAAGNQICAYTIVVSMDSSMIVTEMDLSLSSNTIYVGNSVSAQLQVRPTSASNYATVALTSSNEKVATVNNFGRVTGIAPGTATITATCGSVTATTNVTVMSIPNSSTGTASTGSSNSGQVVTVNPSYVVLKPGATRTLTASVKPSSASQKFTYKSANSNIATVSPSGVITAVGTGATSITVSNGTASAMVTVIVNRSAASSSDNSSDSSSTEPDNDTPIEIDPVVQAIQDSEDNEIVFTQAEVPTVTGDILNALRTTGKTLCVVGDGYTMQIAGSGVKSTTSELDTMLILTESDQGIEFELDKGTALPCSVRIDLDVSTYTRLYLYNAVSNKWQYLNSDCHAARAASAACGGGASGRTACPEREARGCLHGTAAPGHRRRTGDGQDVCAHVQPAHELRLPPPESAAGFRRVRRAEACDVGGDGLVSFTGVLRFRGLARNVDGRGRRRAAQPMPASAGFAAMALRTADNGARVLPRGQMARH